MDCKQARLLLEVAHPLATELEPRDQEQLASHLADCPECGPLAENERRLDEQLSKAMLAVPVPADLSQRILRRLHTARDAWYRGWAVRVAGAAAVLLLAVWLGWALWWNKKPALEVMAVHDEINAIVFNADELESAFAARGVSMTAPRKFDYTNLDSFGRAEIQGKLVPYMLFARQSHNAGRPVLAYVYVLSDRQFDLTAVQNKYTGSRKHTEIFKDPVNPHISYLAIYSGDSLSGFIRPVNN